MLKPLRNGFVTLLYVSNRVVTSFVKSQRRKISSSFLAFPRVKPEVTVAYQLLLYCTRRKGAVEKKLSACDVFQVLQGKDNGKNNQKTLFHFSFPFKLNQIKNFEARDV